MGRWRPPPEKSSPYITPAGALTLKTQLVELWHQRRTDVVPALSAAAAEGDRSENAEYIYRKKQLGEIDRKIRYLTKRLEVIEVVSRVPDKQEKVFFGAWVDVEDDEGNVQSHRIVGADETDPSLHYISVDSPLARAVIGKSIGDEFSVTLPQGTACYWVVGVRYSQEP